ncbi:MAG: glycoside hydrolase family 92 protein [Candidatus Hydrogenedentes bacterium]|nr:glycoside hydrolase family 92 protein [Candidatus Hydrogenedentota bacterium]
MSFAKKALKVLLLLVLAAVALPVLFLGGLRLHYLNIVRPAQTLVTDEFPGPLGAKVNVFSGTGNAFWMCGHNTPAAATPFGMVRLGPDTVSMLVEKPALNRSGYFYGDNRTTGFSHTRLVGADAQEGGVFRVFPTVASRLKKVTAPGRKTKFSHRDEKGFPGYYAVKLPAEGVLAEMTATPRSGAHRYTFSGADPAVLLLDVTSSIGDRRCENGTVSILPGAGEVEGACRLYGSFSGRYDGLDVFFAARSSVPFSAHGTRIREQVKMGAVQAAGNELGILLQYPPSVRQVELRVGISYVSIANARANLDAEAPPATAFPVLVKGARDAWEAYLGRIRVKGGTETQQRILHTALYRTAMMPTLFTDVTGEYMGFDKAVHRAEGFTYYTDFSLWDTFRTAHPLYNLVAPGETGDFMRSLLEMAKAGGAFPRWPSGAGYTNCMFGTPADAVVSEAWLKGIRGFDIEAAYTILRQTATSGPPEGCRFAGRGGLQDYLQYGYCPTDKMRKAVSATLEYAWEDHALSLLAGALGKEDDAREFARRAQFYRNLWNPATRFFQPRDSQGRFTEPFEPLALSYTDFKQKYTKDFVEGSPMQWRWCVPHDPEGLVSLFGGPQRFVPELESFMEKTRKKTGAWHPGSHYWHGNEHHLNAAYLFNHAGRRDLTQKWVRRILDTKYADDYVGVDGNDDGGTLSSWYVLSALGIYPIAGTVTYELGIPLFDEAVVDIGGGKTLKVTAENNAPGDMRVREVTAGGTPVETATLTHDQLMAANELRFVLTPPK